MAKHAQTGTHAGTLLLLLAASLVLVLLLSEADAARSGRRRGGVGDGRRRRNKRGNLKCSESSLAEYKLTFHGVWSPDKFPRMYPRRRPPAQWSKLVGRSHDPTYHMWKLGQRADPALKSFVERGDSSLYDTQPQGYEGVFDAFYAEPITSGEGWTSTFLLADGVHSRVSFLVKLVPSPDWFVGVDSLDLCRRGRWRARAHLNLRPVDGGTDRGYTFTSPNWPSDPPEPVYQITSSFPSHPASAFQYSQYRRLPRLAFVDVERVAQYFRKGGVSSLKSNRTVNLKVFKNNNDNSKASSAITTTLAPKVTTTRRINDNNNNDDVRAKMLKQAATPSPGREGVAESARNVVDAAARSELGGDFAAAHTLLHTHKDQHRFPVTAVVGAAMPKPTESVGTPPPSHPYDSKSGVSVNERKTAELPSPGSGPATSAKPSQLRSGSSARILGGSQGGEEDTSRTEPAQSQSEHTFDEPQFLEVIAEDSPDDNMPVDCIVGEWSEWSACSKTCGFGVRTRSRQVLSHSRNAGLACPVLEQETLCGSMKNCNWNHFSILSDRKRSGRVRRRRRRQHDHPQHDGLHHQHGHHHHRRQQQSVGPKLS